MGKVLRAILFANWALSLEERRSGALHGKGIPTLEEAPRGRQEWTWFAAGYRTEGKTAGCSSGRALQLKDRHFSDEGPTFHLASARGQKSLASLSSVLRQTRSQKSAQRWKQMSVPILLGQTVSPFTGPKTRNTGECHQW